LAVAAAGALPISVAAVPEDLEAQIDRQLREMAAQVERAGLGLSLDPELRRDDADPANEGRIGAYSYLMQRALLQIG